MEKQPGTWVYLGIDYDLAPEEQGRTLARFLLTYPTAEKDVQKCLLARPPFVVEARTPEAQDVARAAQAVVDYHYAKQQQQIVRAYVREMLNSH